MMNVIILTPEHGSEMEEELVLMPNLEASATVDLVC